ncbi:hypothetical protein V0U79_11710 [Hyphobacterium sp. HN65]|uniref:Uncharacterized protein n=1 Tax=Hyphobacterium lacteum TaxID=3116575 RepID=A0ABU7LSY8_9PROT|nr:hypothetical protein [Hyphobacterium sp. HN65]MEE2527035.1 hypothetical protein [Hyphobacterium sp. HN65]
MSKETPKSETPAEDEIHPAARPFLWLDSKWAKKAPFWIFGGLAILMLVFEVLNPFHRTGKWYEVLGFYEIEGFVGFCLAVLMGWPLRRLLGRKEDYYDQEGDND